VWLRGELVSEFFYRDPDEDPERHMAAAMLIGDALRRLIGGG
jgi:hypothetical protein